MMASDFSRAKLRVSSRAPKHLLSKKLILKVRFDGKMCPRAPKHFLHFISILVFSFQFCGKTLSPDFTNKDISRRLP